MKYYNFSLFHSIQRNLAAQTGDPDGDGKGGKSIFSLLYGEQASYFEAETLPRIKHKKFGTVSMVNGGNGVHGSQFFITLAPNIDYLDSQNHTVFGEVAEGFDVLNTLNEAIVDVKNMPYKDIRIFHTVVLDDPFEDPPGLESYIPDRSPSPTPEKFKGGRIGVDEEVDDDKGLSAEAIEIRRKEKEAKANAQILEMVGDLPDVDVKPPDNVLFVCKLNPVTTSEDLEIIFSRFGTIVSCEVIKDQKTKESLQYAFIEFEKPEDCEKAYFKMDNVLIDERRIHVDFSQSVSKVQWNPKGKRKPETGKEEEKEQLRIKHPDDRRNDKYDLVFEEATTSEHKRGRKKSKDRAKEQEKHHKQKGHTKSERSRSSSRSKHTSKRSRKQSRSSSEISEHMSNRRRSRSQSSSERHKHKHKNKKTHRKSRSQTPPKHTDKKGHRTSHKKSSR